LGGGNGTWNGRSAHDDNNDCEEHHHKHEQDDSDENEDEDEDDDHDRAGRENHSDFQIYDFIQHPPKVRQIK
jgi:hypothetical protein